MRNPEREAYQAAKGRCQNPNNAVYHNYGGRGIEFRFKSYDEFISEVGVKPSPNHSLDRKDNDGHYEPGNIKWSTPVEQNRNRRNNRILKYKGESKTVTEWSEHLGISRLTLMSRLNYGWSIEDTLETPVGVSKFTEEQVNEILYYKAMNWTNKEISDELCIPKPSVKAIIKKHK